MKVATWNVGGCHLFNGESKDNTSVYNDLDLAYFANVIKTTNADCIGLQETLTNTKNLNKNQMQDLAKILNYHWHTNRACILKESHIEPSAFMSLGSLSKLPVIKTYYKILTNPNLKITRPNGEIWITLDSIFEVLEIQYKNHIINFANCHLIPLHYFNKNYQDKEFYNLISETELFFLQLSSKPTIVLGDFNFDDLQKIYPSIFKNNLYNETFKRDTTPYKGQQDHILYSNHWKMADYRITKHKSDHYLCEAEINL